MATRNPDHDTLREPKGARTRRRRRSMSTAALAKLAGVGRVMGFVAQTGVFVAVVLGVIFLRTNGALAQAEPASITPEAASADLQAALESKGGLSFTVVQHTTIRARPGGPLLSVADPSDPRKVIGDTDSLEQRSYIERGGISADGFWMEMRDGPVGDAAPDFANAAYQFGAIVTDGKTYRNEGEGWYVTDRPPGIGIDPATAALLPTLAASIKQPASLSDLAIDGATVRQLSSEASVADIPGIQAVDLADASEFVEPLEYGFDDAGRLVRIHAVVRNTQVETFDLLVDVVIALGYGDAGPIPAPEPLLSAKG